MSLCRADDGPTTAASVVVKVSAILVPVYICSRDDMHRGPLAVYIIIYCNSIIFHPICLRRGVRDIPRLYWPRVCVFFSYPGVVGGGGGDLLKNIYVFFRPTWRGQAAGKIYTLSVRPAAFPSRRASEKHIIYICIYEKMKKGRL